MPKLDSYGAWDGVEDVEMIGVGQTSNTDVNPLISQIRDHDPKAHTHTASEVTDFDTEISNNADVAANSSARHSHSNKTVLDDLGDDGSGNLTYKGSAVGGGGGSTTKVYALYFKTTSQTLSSTAATIDFDSMQEDTDSAVTTGSAWKFTAPKAGLYLVQVQIGTESRVNGELWLRLSKNGTEFQTFQEGEHQDNWTSMRAQIVLRLAASDTIHIEAWTAGGATGTPTVWNDLTHIAVTEIGQ